MRAEQYSSPPIFTEEGVTFYPFAQSGEFLADKPKKYYRGNRNNPQYDTFLCTPFVYRNIEGHLSAVTAFKHTRKDFKNRILPLGPILPEKGGIQGLQVPLELQLEFRVRTLRDYAILYATYLSVQFDDEFYFLDCIGDQSETVAINSLGRGDQLVVATRSLFDGEDLDRSVGLPRKLDPLKRIGATFYRYDSDDDDDRPIIPTDPRALVPV